MFSYIAYTWQHLMQIRGNSKELYTLATYMTLNATHPFKVHIFNEGTNNYNKLSILRKYLIFPKKILLSSLSSSCLELKKKVNLTQKYV